MVVILLFMYISNTTRCINLRLLDLRIFHGRDDCDCALVGGY